MGANPTSAPGTATAGGGDVDPGEGSDLARAALSLARRFAAGGTLWCLAPEWPEHGRHVAVEFVHPVIMGKRALPAVSVAGADPAATLRTASCCGDSLLVVAAGGSRVARDVLRRSPAWGLTSFWIGWGERPADGPADHLIWVAGSGATAAHDGQVVLRYHVLWELTHVCFEHPGLLADASGACEDGTACVTCSDEGRLAEVGTALGDGFVSVRTARGVETVDATLLGAVAPGDLLVVHAGTAIERVDTGDG